MDLREYYRILKRRKWVIFVSFLIVFVSYVFTLLNRPIYYHAYSTIILRDPTIEERLFSAFSGIGGARVTMQAQLQLMGSSFFKKRVAETAHVVLMNPKLDIENKDEKKEFEQKVAAVAKDQSSKQPQLKLHLTLDEVAASVAVAQVGDTGMIRIDVSHREEHKAKAIANAYAWMSMKRNKEISQEQFEQATAYIKGQLKKYQNNLIKAEGEIREFNRQEGVIDFDAEVLDRIARLSDYHVSLEQLDMQEQEGKLLSSQIAGQMTVTGETKLRNSLIPNPILDEYQRVLFPMELQLVELEEKYTPEHPKIAVLTRKIKDVKDRLNTKVSKYVEVPVQVANPAYEYLSQQLIQQQLNSVAVGVRRKAIANFIEKEQNSLSMLSGKQLKYARSLREKNTSERLALALQDMLERMSVAAVMKTGNAQILDLSASAGRVSPFDLQKISLMLIVAFACSVFVGVAWELLDDTIKTPHEVKRYMNLSVLGSIPHVSDNTDRLITKLSYKMPLCDAYNKTTFQMESLCLDLGYKALLFTSAKSGEGKSTVLTNTGISLARNGEKVVLVDGDLRRPSLHKLMGVTNTVGFTSILTGELVAKETLLQISQGASSDRANGMTSMESAVQAVMQPTEVDGLYVVPSGPLVSNPVGLLRRPEMKTFLEILKSKADIVLFDSPPVMALIDAALLATHVDASIVILDATSIKRREAMLAKQALVNLKAKILGSILNNCMAEEEYYYYYYSSYYSYGDTKRRKSGSRHKG